MFEAATHRMFVPPDVTGVILFAGLRNESDDGSNEPNAEQAEREGNGHVLILFRHFGSLSPRAARDVVNGKFLSPENISCKIFSGERLTRTSAVR